MAFFFTRSIRWVIGAAVLFTATDWFLRNKSYTIGAKKLKTTLGSLGSGGALGADGGASKLAADLRRDYGPHVLSDAERVWLPVSPAPGLHLRLQLIHAGLTEYVGVWAAPLDVTAGFGFHYMNQSCTVTVGALHMADGRTAAAGKQTYEPGESVRLTRFETAAVHLPQGTVLVCYGRGLVPVSGAQLVANTALVHGDPMAALHVVGVYLRAVARELSLWWNELYVHYSKRLLG